MTALPLIPPKLVERHFHELGAADTGELHRALEDNIIRRCGAPVRKLWRDYERGELSLIRLEDEHGCPIFASFYKVETLPDGTRRMDVRDTVSLAPEFDLTDCFNQLIQSYARERGCTLITATTYRAGLAKRLLTKHGWQALQITLGKPLN